MLVRRKNENYSIYLLKEYKVYFGKFEKKSNKYKNNRKNIYVNSDNIFDNSYMDN